MSRKKLSTWAKEQGVHYRTALAWVTAGTMPVAVERTPGGHIRVLDEPAAHAADRRRIALYARVSSSDQKADLDRQVNRLRLFAAGRGLADIEVVKDVGSGLNGQRPKLIQLLSNPEIGTIVVEHRDRLARFGVEYIEACLAAQNRTILVVEAGEQQIDLVQDFVDVVTSMCARIYGRRAAKNRARRALAAAEAEG